GSRLYPSLPHFWLNKNQDLSRDLQAFELDNHAWPVLHLMQTRKRLLQESEERIFTALQWYNQSCSGSATEEVALVHLATAFESLLGLEQGQALTARFTDTILSLLGKTPRLDSWTEQFYRARSKILHEGGWPHLGFYAADRDDYKKILKGQSQAATYRHLTSYGRRVFRLCLITLLSGALAAEETNLHSLFVHNQERLESICEVLAQQDVDPAERIQRATGYVLELQDYWLDSESITKLRTVLAAGRELISTYLETKPKLPVEIEDTLKATHEEGDELTDRHRLNLFRQLADRLAEWKRKEKSPVPISPKDPTNVLQTYLEYASQPSFMLRTYRRDE
ncbi:MAG: hypothetical protein ACOC6F_02435, partial [bacterium]